MNKLDLLQRTSPTIPDASSGPQYHINIEGVVHEWESETITVSEIRTLGGLPTDLPVIEIDLKSNTERQLDENETVTIKPGMGYSKKVSFKRGAPNGY